GSLFYMPDPKMELAKVRTLLKAGGVLVIEIPGYAYHRLWRTGPVSMLLRRLSCSLPDHLFFFSRKSLLFLLEKEGFRISRGVPLPSSVYGSWPKRLTQDAYGLLGRAIYRLSFGRIDLAPRVLYVCEKVQ